MDKMEDKNGVFARQRTFDKTVTQTYSVPLWHTVDRRDRHNETSYLTTSRWQFISLWHN